MDFNDEQQAEVNRLVGLARSEGRQKGKEEAAKELQGQIEQLTAKAAEADTLKGQLESYQGILEGTLAKSLEGLDPKAKAAVEALSLDPVAKLEWLKEHGEVFSRPVGTPQNGRRETVVGDQKRIHANKTL